MKLLISLTLLALANGRIIEEKCDDVLVNHIHHKKETLVDNKDSPYQLAIDYDTNMLFFSYTKRVGNSAFVSGYVNLKNNEFHIIPGIADGFANAVDNNKHIVYLGGSDGLYQYDFDSKVARHIDGTHDSIWQMFYNKDLYYSTYPNEEVFVFKDGQAKRVPELAHTKAMLVALDKNLDYYFSNSSGLFKYTKASGNVSFLGDYNINGLTADINGNLYFSTPGGIYFISQDDKINEIASIDNIYGVAVEGDGSIIYASEDSIVRLTPTKTPCFLDQKKYIGRRNNL